MNNMCFSNSQNSSGFMGSIQFYINTNLIANNNYQIHSPSMEYNSTSDFFNFDKFGYNLTNSSIINLVGDKFNMFEITKIESNELILKFYSPINVKYYLDENGYYCDYDELDIHSYGSNLQELIESFKEDVIMAWKLYVDCDEKILSSSALRLRNTILKLLKRI